MFVILNVSTLHMFCYIYSKVIIFLGFPGGSAVKNLLAMQEPQETKVWSLGQEDPLEEGMVTHSSILVWRIPWTEEPGELLSMGLERVGHNWNDLTHMQNHISLLLKMLLLNEIKSWLQSWCLILQLG